MISPVRVYVLAANTVREAIRSRVLYVLVFFAILLIGSGVLLDAHLRRGRADPAGHRARGDPAVRAALAISIGIGLVHRDVERRTIFTILSKPVSRTEFLLGKYLGLVATIWLQVAVMGVAFAGSRCSRAPRSRSRSGSRCCWPPSSSR